MRRIDARRRALADLYEQALHIALDSPEGAARFLESARATFGTLAEHPRLGRRRSDLAPPFSRLRSFPMAGFPNHLVFYEERRESIVIVRVLHGARDIPHTLGGGGE